MNNYHLNIEKYLSFFYKIFFPIIILLTASCQSISPTVEDLVKNKGIDVESSTDISNIKNAVPKKESKSKRGNPKSYVVFGKRYYVMESSDNFTQKGIASWYGPKFHGKKTSNGEVYDMYKMTAAHKELPLPTYLDVTNIKNGKTITVRVNDRGPFHDNRIVDLSYSAAKKLGIIKEGTGLVEIKAINPASSSTAIDSKPYITTAKSNQDVINEQELNTSFYIQVGSFSKKENAIKMKKKLDMLGDGLIKISPVTIGGDKLYRVNIGPLSDVKLADAIVSRLPDYDIFEHKIITY